MTVNMFMSNKIMTVNMFMQTKVNHMVFDKLKQANKMLQYFVSTWLGS